MPKEKVFAVFGLGSFGLEVCRVLAEKGSQVIAVDHKVGQIEKIKNLVTQAILIDSTDEESLKAAPIEDVDIAIVGIGENIESSILTTAILKNLSVPHIIARAISDIHAQVLRQVGATEVINIEIEEGNRLANRLISPDIVEKIPIGKNQILAEVLAPKSFFGKTLQELDLRKKFNINVITIKRIQMNVDEMGNPQEEETISFPGPLTTVQKNDIMVVVGAEREIERLKDL